MTRRIVTALLLAASCVSLASAQTAIPDRSRPTGFREEVMGLGFFVGPVGGIGVSFRHHLRTPFSYQITAGVIKVDQRLLYDIAGELQYDVSRGPEWRFFVGGGVGYYFAGRLGNNEMKGPGRVGVGGGGEFAVGPNLGFTLEFLFTYFSDGNVIPLPQAGIFFYF